MTTDATKYKDQRDRYVAFALAAADLLIELDNQWQIVDIIGASKTLLKHKREPLTGTAVADLFCEADRGMIRRLLNRVRKTGRLDLTRVALDQGTSEPLMVHMGACFLKASQDSTFLTVCVLPFDTDEVDLHREAETNLLDSQSFQAYAREALGDGRGKAGRPSDMQLIRLEGLKGAIETLDEAHAGALLRDIGSMMRAQSLGGQAAGRLGEEEFGVLTPPGSAAFSREDLTKDIVQAAREAGLAPGAIAPSVINVNLSTGNLDADSIKRALAFVVNNFCSTVDCPPTSLEESLTLAMDETVETLSRVKNVLENDKFRLFYQPVVSLNDRHVHHYEALLRFDDGRNPYETIRFSEQVGFVQEFDLAVCRKAVDFLYTRPDAVVAVNLSGGSVQSGPFCDALRRWVMPHTELKNRLLFELTESHAIEDIESAANFLSWLRKQGFKVCLDDFGAGAAAYNYLRRFDVDFLKIDGEFLKTALTQKRQRALVRSIATLCEELGTKVIGEMIETEQMAVMASSLGIGYGQGWLFGKPKSSIPEPVNAQGVTTNARRKGASEGWG